MKVFVAGATGAIGKRLVPLLVAGGYEVAAMTRSADRAHQLAEAGAEPVVADGLDRASLMQAVMRAEPEVLVHQLTGLAGVTSLKQFDDELAPTNRLRSEGIDYLLEAAHAVGARRVIAQSYGVWNYEGASGTPATEDDPLDPSPPATMTRTLETIRRLESAVADAEGIAGLALRYGFFYGPGTGIAQDGSLADLVRGRKLPVIGDGAGTWSFVHVDDAASATMDAIEHGTPGVYNVADDEPTAAAVWVPELASVLGAKPPRRVPEWIGRLAAGESGVYLFTRTRGISNARARRELGWRPRYATWRDGFRHGLADDPTSPEPIERALKEHA